MEVTRAHANFPRERFQARSLLSGLDYPAGFRDSRRSMCGKTRAVRLAALAGTESRSLGFYA
jgi:hypothetical protein